MDLSKVTRVEIIDRSERSQADLANGRFRWFGVGAETSLEDAGRTLKIFLTDSPISAFGVRAAITGRPPEDMPQVAGLMTEDLPAAARKLL